MSCVAINTTAAISAAASLRIYGITGSPRLIDTNTPWVLGAMTYCGSRYA